jgi:hypothetical protein
MSDELDRVDCLQFPGDAADTVRLVPAGLGERVVAAHDEERRRRNRLGVVAAALLTLLSGAVALVVIGPTPITAVGTVLIGIVSVYAARRSPSGAAAPGPDLVATDIPVAEARARYEVAAESANPFEAGTTDSEPATSDGPGGDPLDGDGSDGEPADGDDPDGDDLS